MSKFQPGQSGNPNGKPKGCQDKRRMYREMIESQSEELIQKAMDMALDGNEQMMRLLLERLLPTKPKEDPLPSIELPEGKLADKARHVIKLIADGELTTTQGTGLLHALKTEANLFEIDELDRQVKELKQVAGL